jgi:hypothetical protein
MRRAALAAAILVASCTPGERAALPSPGPAAVPTAASPRPPVMVPVIARAGHPAVDGMRLAADQADVGLDLIDPGGDPTGALRDTVASRPPVVLVLEASGALGGARPEIEAAGVPVIVISGDLYSDRQLFRYAFQTSIPLRWQARVLAHYLVADRGYERIALVGNPELGGAALAEEGASPSDDFDGAQAVLALEGAPRGLSGPQLAVPTASLASPEPVPEGTVACAPYTWAGWADPIPRVHRFRDRFAARYGREASGLEQEGYDAVRAVADALAMADGRGGDALVRALESFREETYSSTPIRLGPDDHVFAEESHLGLFVVSRPEEPAPGEDIDPVPWRPLMRTFTTNGKRVNLAEPDVRTFFPSWRPMRPRPNYWRSEYGIVTRPGEDPLY